MIVAKFLRSEFGKGNLILFITMNIFNFLNFVFHFSMGRLLIPSNYGILAALMSLIYFYNIPAEALQNITSKNVSKFRIKKEYGKIKYILLKMLKKSFYASLILFFIITLFSIYLSNFLKINFWLIFVTNIYIFFAFLNPILRGSLQGDKKFGPLGTSLIIDATSKLILSILLVFIGFEVFGAIIGAIFGSGISFIFTIYFNKDIIKGKNEKAKIKRIYSENTNYFITMLVIFAIFSIDILIAKRFFSPEIAGQYAVLSMLGKIIFLATLSISKAMFPLACENHNCGKPSKYLFQRSFLMVGFICLIAIFLYLTIPKSIIWLLYGAQYLEMSQYLVYSGIAFSFLSLGNLVLIYGLSIKRIKKSYLLFGFVFITLALLSLFHNTILEFILAFMISNLILFVGSLIFILKIK